MAFTFQTFSYIIALKVNAVLICFTIIHAIACEGPKTEHSYVAFSEFVRMFFAFFYGAAVQISSKLVLPEFLLHLFFNILFVAAGEWFSVAINVPLIAFHINRYRTRMSRTSRVDRTSTTIKLVFYILTFFYYQYRIVYSLTSQWPTSRLNQL